MNRADLIEKYEAFILNQAVVLFNLKKEALQAFKAYEGCANLVYACQHQGQPVILRVSYRQERSHSQILAELNYIRYLAENGVRVSKPIRSVGGNILEELKIEGITFYLVCFTKGRGSRVPDNNYRYRQDAPIEEYFQNWGAMLGRMHSLSQRYQNQDPKITRPDWFQLHSQKLDINAQIPDRYSIVKRQINRLLDEIHTLPKDPHSYGLIHGDFNDGNFTVDYSNGDMTVFDFDDSCYFWFVYELASAWEGGIGRAMFKDLPGRLKFMEHYMNEVLLGYNKWNALSDDWLERIPLFIKLIQVEEFLHYAQYIDDDDAETQAHLRYLIACIEQDLPYMGFYAPIYSPEHPFSL